MTIERTPWPAWLRAAALIGLTPEAFWRLGVAEWRVLTAQAEGEVLRAADLQALQARFPDEV